MFDEFDAIGKERGDIHETGEIKRVVSSLLLKIYTLPSYVVVVLATNHDELLDRAAWRRFQIRLTFPAPTKHELAAFFSSVLKGMPGTDKSHARAIANVLFPVSFAEATEFLIDLRRRHVLSLGQKRVAEIIEHELPLWAARGKVKSNDERSDQTTIEVQPVPPDPEDKGISKEAADATDLFGGPTEAAVGSKTRRSGKGAVSKRRSARS